MRRALGLAGLALFVTMAMPAVAAAPTIPLPRITIGAGAAQGPQDVSVALQIMFLLTVL